MNSWKFYGASADGEPFLINGQNMWQHTWHPTNETAQVNDPLWNGDFSFPIYQIKTENQIITFATGEFSNTIWGIFIPAEDFPENHTPFNNFPWVKPDQRHYK
jgi:hypothetical protein